MALKLVSRKQWGARNALRESSAHLSDEITCHWEGPQIKIGGKLTWDHSVCASIVRGIQNFHMDTRKWSDIAYNFLECPHGYTFEGRGLNVVNAANGTTVGNRTSHAICCIAGEGNPFTMAEKLGWREAAKYVADKAPAKFAGKPHSAWHSTDCPGPERRAWVLSGMPVSDSSADPVVNGPPPLPPSLLNEPIVDYVPSRAHGTAQGWYFAKDGGVFPVGGAGGFGSLPGSNIKPNKPAVALVPTMDDNGYWVVCGDGGVFPYGTAVGYGSMADKPMNSPIAGAFASAGGYVLVGEDGGEFPFGPVDHLPQPLPENQSK